MAKKNTDVLGRGIYEIAFTERDKEIKQTELMRTHIEVDIEEAVAEFVKAGGSKKLLKRKRRAKLPKIALDGTDPRNLG